jgi:hypothetical protein
MAIISSHICHYHIYLPYIKKFIVMKTVEVKITWEVQNK